ncbi:Lactose phosphotransferase system repressor [Paraliobacillus sp. PM-2]|uniref:DeoR/GlpR family DNA-binding transcription regulator n=1 Tax=Paraliobacillus sp. PM-2 TaxID=1462524 RepID=UPI00061CC33B|nr:DeoR/GlpR family DNA-binding transcription regulator [Paraliobacillus sp. PM-2]CQR45933.1 Lactose phosphotransferase system repressor [Paraliobacillus sp. PM-2]
MNNLKEIRHKNIIQLLEKNNFLKISDVSKKLNVTPMTIRRDLTELADRGLVEKIHGGAKRKMDDDKYIELSHTEKKGINIKAKEHAAKKAAELIEENDIVFIGAGTTTELMFQYLTVSHAKIITNSITIFNQFKNEHQYELILVGGTLREKTGTFVGYFTRKLIQDIRVQKCFIGANGIYGDYVTTADEEEGVVQQIVMNNSLNRYIVADNSKFGVEAFQVLYEIDQLTAIITDSQIPEEYKHYYDEKCKIIN